MYYLTLFLLATVAALLVYIAAFTAGVSTARLTLNGQDGEVASRQSNNTGLLVLAFLLFLTVVLLGGQIIDTTSFLETINQP